MVVNFCWVTQRFYKPQDTQMSPSDPPQSNPEGNAVAGKPDDARIATLAEFWPFYMREHSNPRNRHLHFAGTTLALSLVIAAIAMRRPMLALGAPLAGYGFAWVGHFIVERNRPATFKYPLWSLICDFRLWLVMLSGKAW